MNLRLVLKLALLVLFLAATSRPAAAQSAGTLAGIVLDGRQRPVAGASVWLAGNGLRIARSTDSSGRFAFISLPIGTYALSASSVSGEARLDVDLPSSGATVTLHLLKTVGHVQSIAVPISQGSGTDTVLNQTQITRSPAYTALPNLLLQLPGAARGANGVVHINGDHGDVDYIVDGVSIPQALNREIGSELDPADISLMDVLEGAYPAQYGGRFAAVINIDTKAANGPAHLNGYVSGGSYNTYDSDVDYATPVGSGSLFIASRNESTNRALDPPNPAIVHDAGSSTDQFVRFTLPMRSDFLLASLSHSYQTFQIPNDVTGGESPATDDNETQDDAFASIQFHHTLRNGALIYGISAKRSRIRDFSDPQNDVAYGEALNLAAGGAPNDCAGGIIPACGFSLFSDRTARDLTLNVDNSVLSARHSVRYGASYDATTVQKLYSVTLQPGNFLAPVLTPEAPETASAVVDNSPNVAHTENGFVQDSWQIGNDWRMDYGLRADAFQIVSTEFARGFSQISPRLKVSRLYGSRADVYLFGGRFFTPFSFENVSPSAAQLLNLPLEPSLAQFDLRPQRDTDIEIGGHLPLGPGEFGWRVMQKIAVDLIDDTQVGTTALHQDINYARGNISSQSIEYQQTLRFSGRVYASLAHTRSVNKGCETQLLAPCFGAPDDWTPADHDQNWDLNAGMLINDARGGWLSADAEYGSGLSSAICNPAILFCKVPPHVILDLEKGFALAPGAAMFVSIHNLLNDRYWIALLNAQGNHYDNGRAFTIGLRLTTP